MTAHIYSADHIIYTLQIYIYRLCKHDPPFGLYLIHEVILVDYSVACFTKK
jgi:hypothetical protein